VSSHIISLCSVLPAIVLQILSLVIICKFVSAKNFPFALETDANGLAKNKRDNIKVSVGSALTNTSIMYL
jgi:hypothetical protein